MTRLRAQNGFTMVTMMGVMLIVVTLGVATLSVANGDQAPGRHDRDRRVAYAAAEAGIQNYLFHLVQDNDYWTKCTNVRTPNAVNQRFNGVGADTRTRWLTVPGSTARYAIELLPANGRTSCVQGQAQATMIDTATGTFRIRSTGRTTDGTKRSIIATFRRASFLNYIYFTDLETQDPALYAITARGLQTKENTRAGSPAPPQRNLAQWATETCGATYWYKGRSGLQFVGNQRDGSGRYVTGIFSGTSWSSFSAGCGEIQFVGPSTTNGTTLDSVLGPIHTNDELLVCGFPRMGRSPQDVIEVSGPGRPLTSGETNATVGWRANTGCTSGSKPKVNFSSTGSLDQSLGIWRPNSAPLTLPPSNTSLKRDTAAAYRFVGNTKITLNGASMTVTGTREDGTVLTDQSVALPTDGVVYVANGSCGASYDPLKPYASVPAGCGNAEIKGTYSQSVTITAENDILILDDLKMAAGSDALLGLISNNFIRVYHPTRNNPVYDSSSGQYTCTNQGGPAQDIQVDAAILSLSHSFIHDQYYCGSATGTLTINGAIAQKFRGPVGTGSGSTISTGYIKKYAYDDRLRFRSPPKFLDPVRAGWLVQLYTEQVPAT
jgi:Tfp pilus assembly protein PilX